MKLYINYAAESVKVYEFTDGLGLWDQTMTWSDVLGADVPEIVSVSDSVGSSPDDVEEIVNDCKK